MQTLSLWLQKMTESFENLAIDLKEIPSAQEGDYQKIEPAYRKVAIIGWSILFLIYLIVMPIIFYFNDETQDEPIFIYASIALGLFLWGMNILWVNAAFKKKKYMLRQKDLIYTKGLLWSKRTTIPFNRIQHAEVKQGPLERMFKLHNLKVFTAGGSSSDLSIPGLTEDNASRMKEYILNKIEEEEIKDEH